MSHFVKIIEAIIAGEANINEIGAVILVIAGFMGLGIMMARG